MQNRKWIATDPAPGNDTFRTHLLPLCVQTCYVSRPTNCAGLLSGNESCFAAGALFGRNENRLYLRRAAAESTLAQSCYDSAGRKESPAQTTRFLWGPGRTAHETRRTRRSLIVSVPGDVWFLCIAAKELAAGAAKSTPRQIIIYYSRAANFYPFLYSIGDKNVI